MSYTKVVMRVIRPQDFKRLPKRKKSKKPAALLLLIVLLGAGFFVWQKNPDQLAKQKASKNEVAAQQAEPAKQKTGALKTFTSDQFHALARGIKYPNTQLFTEPPAITGSPTADARIRALADRRGYKLTSIPMGAIVKINEPRLDGDDLLQPLAAIAWQDLKAAAHKDGMPLAIISAYRSPEYQRDLFMKRLLARNVSVEQIAAGQGDAAIESTLGVTAVPGYSRHHTGYTIDLWCEDGSSAFLRSRCYRWISADNYKKAKQTGWIPSYPDGVQEQGPEPEPWEYIWVGKENLTE
jgi:LAS superfamily LD-carboxypeptidase LdcB